MQTILGSGGSIGTELAKELKQYTDDIKLVSRNPRKVNDTDILHSADLSDAMQIDEAVQGSDICYVTLGFDYNIKVWKEKWLPFMTSVVEACIRHSSKLVFFDNVYAIGGNHVNHITEDSPRSLSAHNGRTCILFRAFISPAKSSTHSLPVSAFISTGRFHT